MFRFEKLYPKAPWKFQTSQLALDMALNFYTHSSAIVLSMQACIHTHFWSHAPLHTGFSRSRLPHLNLVFSDHSTQAVTQHASPW